MRSLFRISAVLIVIACVASVHLWRELRKEQQLSLQRSESPAAIVGQPLQ
jgi:sensor domain CHASE-containing protein